MAYFTKVDLARQAKIFTGETATFQGSINLLSNFTGKTGMFGNINPNLISLAVSGQTYLHNPDTNTPTLTIDGSNTSLANPTLTEWKFNSGPRIAAISILGGFYGAGAFNNQGGAYSSVNTSLTGTII